MRITEITLLTDDLPGTEKFYSEILGFEITGKAAGAISFSAGQSTLTFTGSEQVNPQYHFACNIPHNQLNEAVAWASSKFELLPVEGNDVIADFKNWNAKAFYFRDNNGNILEFIARFGLDNASVQPFSGMSVECISEIGIVTGNPLELGNKLVKKNDINFFSKGPVEEKFAVMGDDNGLLILSQTGRHWYPTTLESKRCYLKINFITENKAGEVTTSELTFPGS